MTAIPTEAMVEAAAKVLNDRLAKEEGLFGVSRDMLSAALSAGQAKPVAIKPLEWEYVERRAMTYTAFWADGDVAYYINQSFGSDSYYFRTIRWPEETIYDGDDLPSAKAAAQSDYETRIRSALVSAPSVPGEVHAQLALIKHLAEYTTEKNWADKRLYIMQAVDRALSAPSASIEGETP